MAQPLPLYLDTTVFTGLAEGRWPALRARLEALRDSGRVVLPFSDAHVEEITRPVRLFDGEAGLASAVALLDDMARLSKGVHAFADDLCGLFELGEASPVEVFLASRLDAPERPEPDPRALLPSLSRRFDALEAAGADVSAVRHHLLSLVASAWPVTDAAIDHLREEVAVALRGCAPEALAALDASLEAAAPTALPHPDDHEVAALALAQAHLVVALRCAAFISDDPARLARAAATAAALGEPVVVLAANEADQALAAHFGEATPALAR